MLSNTTINLKFINNFILIKKPKFNTLLLIFIIIFYKILKLLINYPDLIFNIQNLEFIELIKSKTINDKSNIFGPFYIFDVISNPLLIYCLLKEYFKGNISLYLGALIILIYNILCLQTGRFQILSYFIIYYGLIKLIKKDNIPVNLILVLITIVIFSFPILQSIRSGEFFSTDLQILSVDYFLSVFMADTSPGLNFLDLVDYVDINGFNLFYYVLLVPLQFIPRIFWGDKPTTSLQADYSNLIYGIDHLDGVSYTFTFFDSYSYFGLISLFIFTLIYSYLFLGLYKFFMNGNRNFPITKISIAFLLVNSFNFYRGAILDFIAPIIVGISLSYFFDLIFFHKKT